MYVWLRMFQLGGLVSSYLRSHESCVCVCVFCCRVGCMVASMEDINVSAVVCLGYPLKVCCFFYDLMSILSLQYKLIAYGFLLLLPWGSKPKKVPSYLSILAYSPCLIFLFSR